MKRILLLALLLSPATQAAIAFRSAGTVLLNNGAPTSVTLGTPAGVVATDVVLAVLMFGGAASQVVPPSGWTLVKSLDNVTPGSTIVSYWALGSVVSYAFGITGGALDTVAGVAAAYSGVDNTTPMDATAVAQNNAASGTITAPSITTVTANAEIVFLGGPYDGGRAAAGTFTQVFATLRASGALRGLSNDTTGIALADAAQAAAGASGTKTETYSVAVVNTGILAALRPAGAAATTRTRTLTGTGT